MKRPEKMKYLLYVSIVLVTIISGCKKEECEHEQESTPTNPCESCTNLDATGVSNSDAQLHWTSEARDYYQVEIGLNGFSLGDGNLDNSNLDYINISGLSGNTAYDFYVRGNCGGNSWSDWSGPHSFVTD